jgi:hypothetical protein
MFERRQDGLLSITTPWEFPHRPDSEIAMNALSAQVFVVAEKPTVIGSLVLHQSQTSILESIAIPQGVSLREHRWLRVVYSPV